MRSYINNSVKCFLTKTHSIEVYSCMLGFYMGVPL